MKHLVMLIPVTLHALSTVTMMQNSLKGHFH
jgi:hypothetical protein